MVCQCRMARMVGMKYPKMQTQKCPHSEKRRCDKLPHVRRYMKQLVQPMHDQDIQEEVHRHKNDKPYYFSRALASTIPRIIDPVAVNQEKYDIASDCCHNKASRIWDTSSIIE